MLQEKYGGEFIVQKVYGRRCVRIPGQTEVLEETEMLVHPADRRQLLFEARMQKGEKDTKLYDEYAAAWAERIYEERIRKAAGELLGKEDRYLVHVEAGSKSFPDDCFYLNNGRITPEEFAARKQGTVWAILVMCDPEPERCGREEAAGYRKIADRIRSVSGSLCGSIYFYGRKRSVQQRAKTYLRQNAKVDYGFDRIAGRHDAEFFL
jgi:hypothetical protein